MHRLDRDDPEFEIVSMPTPNDTPERDVVTDDDDEDEVSDDGV